MKPLDHLSIICKHCDKENLFDQPYPYHAGFSDDGFLYSDSGVYTLVWNICDPVFKEMFFEKTPWTLSSSNRRKFEKQLPPAPDGGRWRFHNPARCVHCKKPILGPMLRSIHYLVYPGSVVLNQRQSPGLKEYFKPF